MWQLNYSVVVAEDTVRSLNAEMHRFSFETTLRRAARGSINGRHSRSLAAVARGTRA